jgi:hypothetical protein
MTSGIAGFVGAQPTVTITPIPPKPKTEVEKYAAMWERPEYRQVAPGEHVAQVFLGIARPKPGATVIDFGTGTGRGALGLALFGGLKVEMLDFTANCLDPDIKNALTTQAHMLKFTQHDLTDPCPVVAEYGFCTDVLEHIPTADVDRVLRNMLKAAQHLFLQISCEPDHLGALIGETLHLTVQPFAWWLQKLQALDCLVHFSHDAGTHCLFYVTAWAAGKDIVAAGTLNVEEATILANVRANIAGGWMQAEPHMPNDVDVMILAGGPSLADYVDTIKQLRQEGVKLITLNGTYNWALDQGMKPSAQVVVDARPFNARFTKPVIDDCKYLIASQVDPSVLEGLPKDRTYLWHTGAEYIRDDLMATFPVWYTVPGGSTVMLRAIPLLRMLGFKRFHLFGFDSCLRDQADIYSQVDGREKNTAAHHAYAQPENDDALVVNVTAGGRIFQCHPWMACQAQEFMDLVKYLGDEIELEVYGDGLINHILRSGAEISED